MKSLFFKQTLAALISGAVALALVLAVPAAAHRGVEVGKYKLVFGGRIEPVINGERNWIEAFVTDTEANAPVEVADLAAVITHESHETKLVLQPVRGQPGTFAAAVLFTVPGKYAVRVVGSIEGVGVEAQFETTVQDRLAISFPAL